MFIHQSHRSFPQQLSVNGDSMINKKRDSQDSPGVVVSSVDCTSRGMDGSENRYVLGIHSDMKLFSSQLLTVKLNGDK